MYKLFIYLCVIATSATAISTNLDSIITSTILNKSGVNSIGSDIQEEKKLTHENVRVVLKNRAKREDVELKRESFEPCEDGFITLERFIGLPSEDENYYNATAHLEPFRRYLPHADIEIQLVAPATITVDPKIARVRNRIWRGEERTFFVETHSLPSVVNFVVKSAPLKKFPNIESVKLSNKIVCPNPKQWTPTLLGPSAVEYDIGSRILTPEDDAEEGCGRRQIEGVALITNSEKSEAGDWPWHVAVFRTFKGAKKYRCGGSIISQTAILTVAHCAVDGFRPIPATQFTVFTGKYHLQKDDNSSKEYQVLRVNIHNGFNPRLMKNDIALMILSENITYDYYVQPICLWTLKQTSKNHLFGENGTLVGWGSNAPNVSLSETLRSAPLTLVSDTACLLSYPAFFQTFLSRDTFCAGGLNGTGACKGDSGSGFVFPVNHGGAQVWYLRGLVSVSVSLYGTCNPNHFTVFTDSVRYLTWIRDNSE